MITAVTTCMGRLEHLETTLPMMLEEFAGRVVVVDWSCPQKSGDWAAKQGAKVVRKSGEKYWHAAKARNIGAREVGSRSVCFIDADTMPMPGLRADIEYLLNLSTMVIASRNHQNIDLTSLNGFIAVDIGNFWSVKGYNEKFEGYGPEDGYLRAQLRLEQGIKPARVSKLSTIRHTNEMRERYYKEPLQVSAKRNYDALMSYMRVNHNVSDWLTDPRTADIAYRNERI